MDRPVRIASVLVIALACLAHGSPAENGGANAVHAPATLPRAVSPGRVVSPRVAGMLAHATARRESVADSSDVSPPRAIPRLDHDRPTNEIVRLPNYVVRERRLPKPIEAMSNAELARIGMEKYIGPENGLDRGFLNLFTVVGLWKKIPLLGRFPLLGFQTNEERGFALQRAAMKAEEWEYLLSLAAMPTNGDAPASGKK
jgi:hypothetical protein